MPLAAPYLNSFTVCATHPRPTHSHGGFRNSRDKRERIIIKRESTALERNVLRATSWLAFLMGPVRQTLAVKFFSRNSQIFLSQRQNAYWCWLWVFFVWNTFSKSYFLTVAGSSSKVLVVLINFLKVFTRQSRDRRDYQYRIEKADTKPFCISIGLDRGFF